MRPLKHVLLLILISWNSLPIFALGELPPVMRGPASGGTLTRAASRFRELEARLLRAQQDKDEAAVSALLAENFVARRAGSDATTGAEWNQHWRAGHLERYAEREFDAREFGDVVIVSFELYPSSSGGPVLPMVFIVDVWQQSTGRLAIRYESEIRSKPRHGAAARRG